MKYFELSEFADYGEQGFCFTNHRPQGIGAQTYRLAQGIAMKSYPSDAGEVTLQLDNKHDGLNKGSVLGNSSSLLILDTQAKEIVEQRVSENIEFWPFTLLDRNGDVFSQDYFFINPLTALDCIDRNAGEIDFDENGEIDVVWEMVFTASALVDAPHLFRVEPIVRGYYISEELKLALESSGAINIFTKEIEIR